jgi:hypothetical protein
MITGGTTLTENSEVRVQHPEQLEDLWHPCLDSPLFEVRFSATHQHRHLLDYELNAFCDDHPELKLIYKEFGLKKKKISGISFPARYSLTAGFTIPDPDFLDWLISTSELTAAWREKRERKEKIKDFARFANVTADSPRHVIKAEGEFYRTMALKKGDWLWRYHALKKEVKNLKARKSHDPEHLRTLTHGDGTPDLLKIWKHLRSRPDHSADVTVEYERFLASQRARQES